MMKKTVVVIVVGFDFLKEACCSHTRAILLCFLICVFNLCNKIIKINVQFQTVETIGLCVADKSCYNHVEQGCDRCYQFVSETRSCTVAQLDFLFLLKKYTV